MIKSGQVARYSMSFQFILEKNRKIKANYLHIFIINLLCLKYFYSMFMFSMHIVSDSLSYCMINTKIEGFKQKTEKMKILTIKQQ